LAELSESAALDADLLLANACGYTRLDLVTRGDQVLDEAGAARFVTLLSRRMKGEPVAYLLGEKEFYGLDFTVSPDVLIPRPDTELLVEAALSLPDFGTVIDVCTGSGCVAIAIAHHRPKARVIACDISATALEVAQGNARKLSAKVEFRQGNLLEPCKGEKGVGLIVANPPYIMPADMPGLMRDVRDFEPTLALVGQGEEGLGHHETLLSQARDLLCPGGVLMMEIGHNQAPLLAQKVAKGFAGPVFLNDLGQVARVAKYVRIEDHG
jgi:release factor glutamine methyltransferase